MKYTRVLLLLPVVLLSFNFKPADKWVSLFNGKNLEGWKTKFTGSAVGENYLNTFRVGNGILSTRYDQYKTFDNKFGALYYNKKLKNYRLKVEYRFVGELTPGAPTWGYRDGGVQYHSQSPESVGLNQNFPVCLEYNLHGGNGKEDRPTGELCANGTYVMIDGKKNPSFCNAPTVQRTFHGDQWVTLEIEVMDSKVRHFVNGEEILRFEDPRLDPNHEVAKTLIVGDNDKLREGYISLQSNSHPMDFRKIELLEY